MQSRGHQRSSEVIEVIRAPECSSPDDGKGTVEPALEAIEAHQKPSEMSSESQSGTSSVTSSRTQSGTMVARQRQLEAIEEAISSPPPAVGASSIHSHKIRNQVSIEEAISSPPPAVGASSIHSHKIRNQVIIEEAISSPPPAVGASSIQIRGQVRAARLHASGAARPRSRRCTRMRAPRASGATGRSS